jgi:phosphatidylglycerophosphatase C
VNRRLVAAFDFDGTLTRRDTLVPFLVRACGPRSVAGAVAAAAPLAVRARADRSPGRPHPRDVTKGALLRRLLAGREASWLAETGADFARTLPARLRPELVDQLTWHQQQGHEVVLVSASLLAYLQPFAVAHGIDHVIAVGLEVGADGRLTGDLTGPNVRGPEKAVRLLAWLDDVPPAHLWAYGNSSGDTELLAMADVPVWIDGHHHREAASARDRP